jgi:hypothetical protein
MSYIILLLLLSLLLLLLLLSRRHVRILGACSFRAKNNEGLILLYNSIRCIITASTQQIPANISYYHYIHT